MGIGDLCRVPPAAVVSCEYCCSLCISSGEPDKVQGRDRVGIVESSCGYRAPSRSVFGENSFYRETRGTRLGRVAM